MKRKNATRSALLMSIISMLLCVSMLVGTTFAWFTDEVVSSTNVIAAGNLDIELDYAVLNDDGTVKEWKTVDGATNLFTSNLWEPGHTEVVYLKLSNLGALALKYQLGINVASETEGTNVAEEKFKLSDHIYMGVVENAQPTFTSREKAIADAQNGENGIIGNGYAKSGTMTADAEDLYMAVVVYMPITVDNEVNYKTGTARPEINLGINLFATQVENESDSFGNDYDEGLVMIDKENPIVIGADEVTINIPAEAFALNVGATKPNISKPVVEKIIPTTIEDTVKYKVSFDIAVEGIKESNDVPITVTYFISDVISKDVISIEVYHNGVKVDNPVLDAENRTVTFETLSFSPFEIIIDTGYIMIPGDYSNEQAVNMVKNAANGAKIDGNNRVIDLGTAGGRGAMQPASTRNISLANMTLKASGSGAVVCIDGKNQTLKMTNVTIQNTSSSGKSLELSLNGATSLIFENCTFKGKAYFQGSNAKFINCSFDKNNNMDSSATNFSFIGCKFTYSFGTGITMNAKVTDILFESCAFSGSAIRIYKGMAQPTNVRLINNTYKNSKFITVDSGVDYEGWKTNGAWIEEGNTKV